MKIFSIIKSFGIGLIGGLLGALGGSSQGNKSFRRIGIPVLITVIALITLRHWLVLSIMSLYGVLTIGYGIPTGNDNGSPLGRFWYKFFSLYPLHRHLLADIFTRGTIGILSCLTFLSIPIIKSNHLLYLLSTSSIWIVYIIGTAIVTTVYSLLSWRTLGSVNFFGISLTWAEIIPYAVLTTFAMILIF